MTPTPQKIRALRGEGVFEIVWSPEECRRYPFKFLRCACPCAGCINEFTGEQILDPATIPETIHPAAVEFSGNYALKIQWSDGHATGLYSWELLHRLASAPEVLACPATT
ncbi:DUF971 domain-containing protein [Planctomicrobium piriforme]|uniref:DUF971 family protein n=1 Tax=Planctomicrobium piriforme TaxID=1576369 RepID=A0A1I3F3V0_9PLAN|nr:DUF971 domain-containing protein [Planctomicrobium piriforme]SFI05915.1 DUF971 family protein [Planctomicrobium piriforme]